MYHLFISFSLSILLGSLGAYADDYRPTTPDDIVNLGFHLSQNERGTDPWSGGPCSVSVAWSGSMYSATVTPIYDGSGNIPALFQVKVGEPIRCSKSVGSNGQELSFSCDTGVANQYQQVFIATPKEFRGKRSLEVSVIQYQDSDESKAKATCKLPRN